MAILLTLGRSMSTRGHFLTGLALSLVLSRVKMDAERALDITLNFARVQAKGLVATVYHRNSVSMWVLGCDQIANYATLASNVIIQTLQVKANVAWSTDYQPHPPDLDECGTPTNPIS